MANTCQLARTAEALSENGYCHVADEIRVALQQLNCCEQCGSNLIWDYEQYQDTGLWMCPICDVQQVIKALLD